MQEPERIGWQRDGDRGVLLRVMCRKCRGTSVAERRSEATLCTACDRLLDTGEIKCCIADRGVQCATCARQTHPIDGSELGEI
jgi:hypothetical protein